MAALAKAYVLPAVAVVIGLWWSTVTDSLAASVVVAVGCVCLVATSEWRSHKLRRDLLPRLGFVIGEGPPFERDKPTVLTVDTATETLRMPAGGMRIHSVGVVNSGQESASGVRVRLVKIDPPELRQYWTAPLHVANEPVPVDRSDVHQTTSPVVFFEVVVQHFEESTQRANRLEVRLLEPSCLDAAYPYASAISSR